MLGENGELRTQTKLFIALFIVQLALVMVEIATTEIAIVTGLGSENNPVSLQLFDSVGRHLSFTLYVVMYCSISLLIYGLCYRLLQNAIEEVVFVENLHYPFDSLAYFVPHGFLIAYFAFAYFVLLGNDFNNIAVLLEALK